MVKKLSEKELERIKESMRTGFKIGNLVFLILYFIITIFLIGLGVKGIMWAWNFLI